jgi:hypothetical protein
VPKGNLAQKQNAPAGAGAYFSTGVAYQISAWFVKRQMQIFSGANATLKIKDFLASEDWLF